MTGGRIQWIFGSAGTNAAIHIFNEDVNKYKWYRHMAERADKSMFDILLVRMWYVVWMMCRLWEGKEGAFQIIW